MNRPSRIPVPAMLGVGLAVVLAACQIGNAGSPSVVGSAGAGAVVEISSSTGLGEHLVDAEGRTLYVFLNDSPGTSVCEAECATNWPPATVEEGTPFTAGEGVTAELGTLARDDGSRQLTLAGWPLYRFAGDAAPGDATGEGVGGVWFVARADGRLPEASAAPSADASADESGGYDPYDY